MPRQEMKNKLNILTISEEELLTLIEAWQISDREATEKLTNICYDIVKSMATSERNKKLSNANTDILGETPTVYTNIALTTFIFDNKNVSIDTKNKLIKQLRTGVRNALIDKERYSNAKMRSRTSKVDIESPIVLSSLVNDDDVFKISDLSKALDELSLYNSRQAEIIKYRYYVDLKNKEIAHLLEISERLVEEELRKGKRWLNLYLGS